MSQVSSAPTFLFSIYKKVSQLLTLVSGEGITNLAIRTLTLLSAACAMSLSVETSHSVSTVLSSLARGRHDVSDIR